MRHDCVRNGVVLVGPEWLLEHRHSVEVSIDTCIADEVAACWARGYRTLGSCCGHGKNRPSLVLANDQEPEPIARLLRIMDPYRQWQLYQWQLVEIVTESVS